MSITRRGFLGSAAAASLATGLTAQQASEASRHAEPLHQAQRPIILSAHNGFTYVDNAFLFLKSGGDTLETAMRVVAGAEDDPNDESVGLGAHLNEDGFVELDACCMHGPTRRAGAVGAVRNIKNVSRVAKAVMEQTGHVMLVGEGAERFAVAVGFQRENLVTEYSHKTWQLWKEYHSNGDWWGPGISSPLWKNPGSGSQSGLWQERIRRLEERAAELGIEPEFRMTAVRRVLFPPTGTIHCSALNDKGEISAVTTTAGLAFKLPGRCGDSPIIGAGCYVDQDVGSAGATGSGEENIRVAGAHTIVENMRRGMSPHNAGVDALKRIVRNYNNDMNKLRFVDMVYYVLRKDGVYAGVSLWEGYTPEEPHSIVIHDGTKRREKTVPWFKGASQDFPPSPEIPKGAPGTD